MNDNNNNNIIITVTLHNTMSEDWRRVRDTHMKGSSSWTKITHMIHWDKENGSNITWLNKYKGIDGHEEWLVTLHNDQKEVNVCRFKLLVT